MSSDKFNKIAKKTAQEDKALFDTLIEFEKTKRIRTKTRLNFTIDRAVAGQFRKYCLENGYNMSAKIERMIRALIKKI